ncbi:hypothetical protein TNCV_4669141 [Trichonephila clavipes]|nr:hypothetical protein TNCV_4669141 [Trichonephila clavipes]
MWSNKEILSVKEAVAVFEELPSHDDSAASNNNDTEDEDDVENVAQEENISSDDEDIYEIQCPTSQPEVKWGLRKDGHPKMSWWTTCRPRST